MKILISLLPLMLILSGCNLTTEEPFDLSEIRDKSDGLYILEDSICTPIELPDDFDSTTVTGLLAGGERTLMVAGSSLNSLPKVTGENRLILRLTDDLDGPVELVKLDDLGMSIGIRLIPDSSGNFKINPVSGLIEDSDAELVLDQVGAIKNYHLFKVGGNVLTAKSLEGGYITGLEEGALYELEFFKGTEELVELVTCDTKVLKTKAESLTKLTGIEYTPNGFAFIPTDNLDSGYYLLFYNQGLGLGGGIFEVQR